MHTHPNTSRITRQFDAQGNVTSQREEFNGATVTLTYGAFSLGDLGDQSESAHDDDSARCQG